MESRSQNIEPVQKHRSSTHRRRGFTLAESLLAAVVLATAAAATGLAMTTAFSQSGRVDQTGTALLLGRQLHEEIAAMSFDQVVAQGSRDFGNTFTMNDGFVVNLPAGFTRQVSLERRITPSGSIHSEGNYLLIAVTVTMPAGQQVTLKRMIARGES